VQKPCIRIFSSQVIIHILIKYTLSVFTKQKVLLNIYIPNFKTFRHLIKKLYSFLFLLKSYCFLYTGLSYYSDDIPSAGLVTCLFCYLVARDVGSMCQMRTPDWHATASTDAELGLYENAQHNIVNVLWLKKLSAVIENFYQADSFFNHNTIFSGET